MRGCVCNWAHASGAPLPTNEPNPKHGVCWSSCCAHCQGCEQGILVLHMQQVTDLLNMRVFVDTDDDVRLARR